MIFTSIEFVFLFLPIVFGIYYFLPRQVKNYYLLVVSLFFYAWGDAGSIGILVFSILLNWLLALRMQEFEVGSGMRKIVLFVDIFINVGLLFFYKYLGFFKELLNGLAPGLHLEAGGAGHALPIGISFFTFKGISYAIDVYRGSVAAQGNVGYFGLYLAFFPQMVAGPIARYSTMAEKLADHPVNLDSFSKGMLRFIIGFNKKVLLADVLVKVADNAFGASANTVCMAWLGAICYTLQIYFDFSGYSDMAIGLAAMFGFDTLENFNYPYISRTITEFWRRWHISLGSWFRDYVYFPLGGSRVKQKSRMIFNLFVVWLLTGIWHGANWTFIIWGLMYGVIISIEKMAGIPKRIDGAKAGVRLLYRAFTLLMIVVGWVLFRSDSLGDAVRYLGTMFGLSGSGFVDGTFVFNLLDSRVYCLFGILFSMPVCGWVSGKVHEKSEVVGKALACSFDIIQVILFVVSISCLVVSAHNPFVYINF